MTKPQQRKEAGHTELIQNRSEHPIQIQKVPKKKSHKKRLRRLKNYVRAIRRSLKTEETPDNTRPSPATGSLGHSSTFVNRVRKIRDQGLASSAMKGKIMNSAKNTQERFIAGSGTTVPIMPLEDLGERVDNKPKSCLKLFGNYTKKKKGT